MTQLFDDDLEPVEHFARASDPSPSHVAAAKVEPLGDASRWVLATLVELQRTNPSWDGATAADITMRMAYDNAVPPDRNCVSRRLTSLVRHGLAEVTGEKRDGGRGVDVTVYRCTPGGRAWLEAP